MSIERFDGVVWAAGGGGGVDGCGAFEIKMM